MRNRGGDASQARPEMPSRGLSSGGLFDPRVDFAAQHPEIDRFGEIRAAIAPSCDAQDARWQWSGHRTGGGGEIGNINHLPHFAATFGSDLAGLYHHQATQLILGAIDAKVLQDRSGFLSEI